MTLRVGTVLSAREWEPRLVRIAQETAAVRLVLRAYQPEDVEDALDRLDVLVVGAETAWVSPVLIRSWRDRGLAVVALHPPGDGPARAMLAAAEADEILADDLPAAKLLGTVLTIPVAATEPSGRGPGQLVAVAGPRGAPGRTEVALGLAWLWSRRGATLLVDADRDAPAVAIRLGLKPRPDLTDASDALRLTGSLGNGIYQRSGKLTVLVGSHRPDEGPLRPELLEEVIEAALGRFAVVVVDLEPGAGEESRLLKRADHAVLVTEAGAAGLVRTARLVAEWAGPPPALVLNRAHGRFARNVVDAARTWTGLEPAAVVPERPAIRAAARAARPPDRALLRALAPLRVPV